MYKTILRALRPIAGGALFIAAAVTMTAAPAAAVSGGNGVTDARYGFVARIELGERAGCTAALVDPLWLITARDCVAADGQVPVGAPAQPTTAVVGGPDLRSGAQQRTVVEVVPHPGRDVALLRLSAPVTGVLPVPLSRTAAAAGDSVRAVGYGRTGTVWAPDTLQGTPFTVGTVSGTAIDLTGAAAVLCQGDAGAPVLRDTSDGPSLAAIATTSGMSGCLAADGTGNGAGAVRADDLSAWMTDVTERPYALHNVVTDKCVDVPGNGAGAVDQRLSEYTCDSTSADNQLWFLDPRGRSAAGEMLYSVRNAKDILCADPPGYDAVPAGTGVYEYYCGGPEDNQFFRMVAHGPGFWLVNDKSNLCLDVAGAATGGNDAALGLAACADNDDHVWRLDRANWTSPPAFQSYAIANLVTAKCVDIPGYGPGSAGGQLYEYTCDTTNADNQLWFFDAHDRTADGQIRYALRNSKDGLCMDAGPGSDGAVGPGAAVVENPCAGGAGYQLFRLVPRGRGVWFVNDRTGLCLDVAGFATGGNDTPLTLYTCADNDDHIWAPRVGTVTTDPGPPAPPPGPVAAPAPAGTAVENFAYPGAAAIQHDSGVTLLSGDGHILFADCATPPVDNVGVLKVWTTEQVGADGAGLVCFRVTATTGWLNLRVPGVYEIRGDGQKSGTGHRVTADVTTDDGANTSVAVNPSGSTQVGIGADPNGRPTTLLRLAATG